MNYKKYFEKINAKKIFTNQVKKYKNKKILLYGAGEYFSHILKTFDLSKLNVVAICDKKFSDKTQKNKFEFYKPISVEQIEDIDYDIILITTLNDLLTYNYLQEILKTKKNDVDILLRPPLLYRIFENYFEV